MAASANQFIGSKISLISKSEIRYEGILYSLDLQDATISLAKVRSFGTEDRPTERHVPPKDEVYEFIIFRGSDIKGIDVLEPPKQAAVGLPIDPAIVEVSHYHSSSSSGHATGTTMNFGGGNSYNPNNALGMITKQQQSISESNTTSIEAGGVTAPLDASSTTHDASRSNNSTPAYNLRKSPTNDTGTQAGNDRRNRQPNNRQYDNNDRRRGGGGGQQMIILYPPRGGRGGYARGGEGGGGRGGGGGPPFRGRGGNMNRGYRTQGIIKAQMPPKMTFEDPFDFEKSNEELLNALEKLKMGTGDPEKKDEAGNENGESGTEQEEQESKEPTVYYDKDNFFDNISCEALERTKGKSTKPDWRAERKLNAETFGISANGPRRGNYRGNYRGYRGYGNRGGFQRGGYGQGYNSGYGYRRGNRGGRSQQQEQASQDQRACK